MKSKKVACPRRWHFMFRRRSVSEKVAFHVPEEERGGVVYHICLYNSAMVVVSRQWPFTYSSLGLFFCSCHLLSCNLYHNPFRFSPLLYLKFFSFFFFFSLSPTMNSQEVLINFFCLISGGNGWKRFDPYHVLQQIGEIEQ